jgi:hypothetical protein
MFCNFCGRNFDSAEGFEEVARAGHHLIRCEKCVYEQREEEYDYHTQTSGGGRRYFSEPDKLKKK